MMDLAVEAFNTENFDLATEIYERNIRENGPQKELYLGLGDSYAKSGQLKKAIEAYSNAFRLGKIKPDKLSHLVSSLIDTMSEKDKLKPGSKEKGDIFACYICKTIWKEPLTLTCGHTFCRNCLEKTQSKECKQCHQMTHIKISSLRTNVLLSTVVEQWFPQEVEAGKLKSQGNRYFEKRQFKEAIEAYSRSYKYAPNDHLLISNRSYAYACLDFHKEALKDAEEVVRIRPDWPKGYFRKGSALSGLEQHEEAAMAYIQCLILDPSITSARTALAKTLHKLLSPVHPKNLKRAELESVFKPSPLSRVLHDPGMMPIVLTESSLQQIKLSLRETLRNAGVLPSDEDFMQQCQVSNQAPLLTSPLSLEKSSSTPNLATTQLAGLPRSPSSTSLQEEGMHQGSRKRSRDNLHLGATSPTQASLPKLSRPNDTATDLRYVPSQLLKKEDFECSLCFRLLHNTLTTVCGHSFCRQCLDRCLDHNTNCPLCKTSLVDHLAERRQATTEAVEEIIKAYFPEDYAERKVIHEQELADLAKMGSDNRHEIPVFVCTMAYPTIRCPLHIFEPRYRLMVRQCMESGSRQFGMCVCFEDDEQNFADYGCMLEIRDVQYFPDGRSVVDAVGGRRFKVLSRGQRDGYYTAKVEFLEETQPQGAEREELQKLHAEVHKEAYDWFHSCTPMMARRIRQHFGDFPEREPSLSHLPHGPAWSWWMIAVLPLDPRAQLSLVAMTSLTDRLQAIRRILTYIKRRGSQ